MSVERTSAHTGIVISAFLHIGTLDIYRNCWISDHFLYSVISFQVPTVLSLGVDMPKMNLMIGRKLGSQMDDITGSNTCGVFRYREPGIICPHDGSKRRIN